MEARTRFLPIYRVVGDWLKAKEIGEIRLLTSTFGFQALRDPTRPGAEP